MLLACKKKCEEQNQCSSHDGLDHTSDLPQLCTRALNCLRFNVPAVIMHKQAQKGQESAALIGVRLKEARRDVVRFRMGVRTGQEKNTAAYTAAKKLVVCMGRLI